jgi:hypothetical protein
VFGDIYETALTRENMSKNAAQAQAASGSKSAGASDNGDASSGHSSIEDDDDDLFNGIFGSVAGSPPAKAARPKAKAAPGAQKMHASISPATKTGRRATASSSVVLAEQARPASGKKEKNEKPSAKAMRSEMGAVEYLDQDGKGALDKTLAEIELKFKATTFTSISITDDHLKSVSKDLKALCGELRTLHSSAINLQWKVKKRAQPHAGALDMLVEFRLALRCSRSVSVLGIVASEFYVGHQAKRANHLQARSSSHSPLEAQLLHVCIRA